MLQSHLIKQNKQTNKRTNQTKETLSFKKDGVKTSSSTSTLNDNKEITTTTTVCKQNEKTKTKTKPERAQTLRRVRASFEAFK